MRLSFVQLTPAMPSYRRDGSLRGPLLPSSGTVHSIGDASNPMLTMEVPSAPMLAFR